MVNEKEPCLNNLLRDKGYYRGEGTHLAFEGRLVTPSGEERLILIGRVRPPYLIGRVRPPYLCDSLFIQFTSLR